MASLRVRHDGRVVDFDGDQPVAFGRTSIAVGESVGWGYPGRFVELGADPSIHRVWCDLVPFDHSWIVRSLGSLNPVTVVTEARTYRLDPYGADRRAAGATPDSVSIASGTFELDLRVGPLAFTVPCEVPEDGMRVNLLTAPTLGNTTTNLALRLAEEITLTEYRVLWAMSRDRREQRGEEPVSYTRIVRSLRLDSKRQAVAAVERLTRRFRDIDLIPPGTPSQLQRRVICERSEEFGLLAQLEERFGPAVPGAQERTQDTGDRNESPK